MKIKSVFFAVFLFAFVSCNLLKKKEVARPLTAVDTTSVSEESVKKPKYQAARKRICDLIHTRLEVQFDWKKEQLSGKAQLTLKPYFNSISEVSLDAKGFDIHEVSKVTGAERSKLNYIYRDSVLKIELGKSYTNRDTFTVYIDYTAKPNELPEDGSEAISEAKGLYFINPEGKEKDKPRQVWSQGETESSSCWFPTIDSPNERMTQEIYITIDTSMVTLSNGVLEYSQDNGDGTRVDYWKQNLPAAPYLTMIAAGKFSVIKDKWRDIEVNYYVEPGYAEYAKQIFGNTPEMLEYFSTKLGVNYPWEKFSQIIVRDYVSGAMENTTAVVHGEFVQRTERELIDKNHEDVIAHELFHHWFGDLVTCESWSNLPLNESFATYGEYLWNEKKYGLDEADKGIHSDMNIYFQQSKSIDHSPIWYYYNDKDDMFDVVSYQKGGRILHMLRNYVGDEAFFKSLKYYLTTNRFGSVEIHDLRQAFEKTTGEDLNWFFNQWFFNQGYPNLDITYSYSDSLKKSTVNIKQNQEQGDGKLIYRIPLAVDIYANGKKERQNILIEEKYNTFVFDVKSKPDLINVDADKMLLCTRKDNKTKQEWAFQYYHAPKYFDRSEAIKKMANYKGDSIAEQVILDGLKDKFYEIRATALRQLDMVIKRLNEAKSIAKEIALNDPKSSVRAEAIEFLSKASDDSLYIDVYQAALNDKSYLVEGAALEALAKLKPILALEFARKNESEKNTDLIHSIAGVYAKHGADTNAIFFETKIHKATANDKYLLLKLYGDFLVRCKDETINKGVLTLEEEAKNASEWYVRLYALQALSDIHNMYLIKENDVKENLADAKKQAPNSSKVSALEADLQKVSQQKDMLDKKLEEVRKIEKTKKDK